jgi:PAS domain S-box-containing protein
VYPSNKGWAGSFVVYLIAISGLITVVAIMLENVSVSSINFTLGFNVFSILSFFSAFVDLAVISLVIIKKRYSLTTNWYLLFLGGATLMAAGEGLQRSSVYPSAALFWQNFVFMGLSLLALAFYLFIVSFTAHYRKQFIFVTSVLILAWGVIVFFAGDGLFYSHALSQIQHTHWGYASSPTKAEEIAISWFSLFYILGTGLLLQFLKTTQNRLIRRQTIYFLVSFLVPFFAAVITTAILPIILPNTVPPLATIVGAFSGIIIYYAIYKYHLLEIDPQALAQNILDTMTEAVIITRQDMSIESINQEAERLLGIKVESVATEKLQTFFSDETWQLIVAKLNDKPNQGKNLSSSKNYVKRSDGKFTPVRVAATSLKTAGETIANILVVTDISEINRSYEALQTSAARIYKQNDDLRQLESRLREEKSNVENIVEFRTKALVEAQSKLKAADQLKTEFIMLTSHNLRTPLAIAKGYAEIITTQYPLSNEQKPMIDGLNNGLDRLGKIVEDLLTISSIESGSLVTMDEISFQELVEPLIQETKDLATTRKDKFIVNFHAGDVKIKANRDRLRGALRNVLNNACKFTENGTVELSTSRSEDRLIINISDTGIGIDPSELPKLYTKFHRAANVLTGGYEGRGIGLYLTRLIIEEHAGKLSVVTQPNKGSTFTIELPCY